MPAQWYNKGLPIRGRIAVIDGRTLQDVAYQYQGGGRCKSI